MPLLGTVLLENGVRGLLESLLPLVPVDIVRSSASCQPLPDAKSWAKEFMMFALSM